MFFVLWDSFVEVFWEECKYDLYVFVYFFGEFGCYFSVDNGYWMLIFFGFLWIVLCLVGLGGEVVVGLYLGV